MNSRFVFIAIVLVVVSPIVPFVVAITAADAAVDLCGKRCSWGLF